MEKFEQFIALLETYVWSFPANITDGNVLPLIVIIILGFGIFITLRLGFVQIVQFKHAFRVLTGRYDNPDDLGDINHFQALSTALSATVGVGNIAGVALAIHIGGPGALFWMWVTALFGMATKFTECTLGAHYRVKNEDGTVSGGPMYYIERGLGPKWKWLAVLFAIAASICALLTGNAIQANTLADVMNSKFQLPFWVTGLVSAALVGAVILGGIKRIGYVTARLVPLMAIMYVFAGLVILLLNYDQIIPSFVIIFTNAFNPQAGALGVGSGALILTLAYGVQRGLFSNEAGQGSSPIAMAASKTDEPVQAGLVGLLGPFIDTIIVCSITGLVIISTGAWDSYHQGPVMPAGPNISYTVDAASADPNILVFENGMPVNGQMLRFNIPVDTMFVDANFSIPFNGMIDVSQRQAVAFNEAGELVGRLFGGVVENVASLTSVAFSKGLSPIFPYGELIVTLAVFFFVISTSISWSYYGERSIHYLLGKKSVVPYRMLFVFAHFLGALGSVTVVWSFGDVMLGIMAFVNITGLILLSPVIYQLSKKYVDKMKNETD